MLRPSHLTRFHNSQAALASIPLAVASVPEAPPMSSAMCEAIAAECGLNPSNPWANVLISSLASDSVPLVHGPGDTSNYFSTINECRSVAASTLDYSEKVERLKTLIGQATVPLASMCLAYNQVHHDAARTMERQARVLALRTRLLGQAVGGNCRKLEMTEWMLDYLVKVPASGHSENVFNVPETSSYAFDIHCSGNASTRLVFSRASFGDLVLDVTAAMRAYIEWEGMCADGMVPFERLQQQFEAVVGLLERCPEVKRNVEPVGTNATWLASGSLRDRILSQANVYPPSATYLSFCWLASQVEAGLPPVHGEAAAAAMAVYLQCEAEISAGTRCIGSAAPAVKNAVTLIRDLDRVNRETRIATVRGVMLSADNVAASSSEWFSRTVAHFPAAKKFYLKRLPNVFRVVAVVGASTREKHFSESRYGEQAEPLAAALCAYLESERDFVDGQGTILNVFDCRRRVLDIANEIPSLHNENPQLRLGIADVRGPEGRIHMINALKAEIGETDFALSDSLLWLVSFLNALGVVAKLLTLRKGQKKNTICFTAGIIGDSGERHVVKTFSKVRFGDLYENVGTAVHALLEAELAYDAGKLAFDIVMSRARALLVLLTRCPNKFWHTPVQMKVHGEADHNPDVEVSTSEGSASTSDDSASKRFCFGR